ncbi:hypothetical protein J4E82_007929 [Alternaria postmessia]|uniref:uncharacterized protein n=1 Tax=Alternaria postmessia TaxID=1187938 RepID=UPI002225523C|nr:uncharacterized protein J4E82_007929 [Alternaria postmessia]KAI5373407.1 hypothetical protein J4E82_007929 [Alternaria postmessia]
MDDISVITQRFDNLLHESTDQAESPSTSQDAQPLQYDRIPRGRSIRVLDLAPGTWDEPVNCSLRTVHLDDDDPRYEAISYAWGDHNDRKPVICNGYAITTTRSLFEALQRFRHVNTTRTLWADALCINQADGDEKTLQVRLMSYIYTKAVRVLVWLQHDDDRIVQDSLNAICRFVSEENGFGTFGGSDNVLKPTPNIMYRWLDVDVTTVSEMESSEVTDVAIDALQLVCSSPWFSRGWVVQEVALSTSASVFWGHSEIDFDWLGIAVYCVIDIDASRLSLEMGYCQSLSSVWSNARRSRGLRQSLFNLIALTSGFIFGEPKDRIYGLLGLKTFECDLADGQSFIDPDYNITTMECYRRVAAKLLTEWHDFRPLSWMRSVPQSAEDWPSWVPDWYQDFKSSFAGFEHTDYQKEDISDHIQVSETSLGGVQCIEISGFKVDTINREIKEYVTLLDFDDDDDVRSVLEAFQALLRRLEHIYGQQCLAFTFGNSQRYLPLDAVRIMNLSSEYGAFLKRDFVQDIYSPTGSWVDDEDDSFVPSADRFVSRCSRDATDRCLFITSTEMLGIGPHAMIPGDVVVMLHGAEVPFVLRPVDNGLWRLIGECYLYDVNEGRVHREWKEKGSVSEKFTIC